MNLSRWESAYCCRQGKRVHMNDPEQSRAKRETTSIIKVVGPDKQYGRTPSPYIPLYTKLQWKVAYWWHLHGAAPDWRSPRWFAGVSALLLALVVVAVSAAYFPEAEMRISTPAAETNTTEVSSEPVTAVATHTYAAASSIYVVQPEDTLYRIANRHGTSMQALDQINQLHSTISVGQVLVIPPANYDASAGHTAVPTDQYACAQFSFAQGETAGRGAQAGVYALYDVTGGQIAAWSAPQGAVESGWIYDLPVAFSSVHARVLFYPRFGGGTAVEMLILNHAPDSTAGWLTRGMCHSLELAYPGG
ncbi:MAG: LysM peptidoglycan-binding domain-containing protein [Anaerolineae bacterium]|nr:LysM peptidoglycan-binding domain-containing protein [Anaerolineae bacterium]